MSLSQLVFYTFKVMKKIFIIIIATLFFISCNNSQKREQDKKIPVEQDNGIGDGAPSLSTAFAQGVEKTHNKEAFLAHNNISFDIALNFNGQERLKGTFTMRTNSSKIKFESKDGKTIIYNGEEVYRTPKEAEMESARFDILTWPYFMAMPFKLTDGGTIWSDVKQVTEKNRDYSKAKLTFEAGVGDTAEDWYQVYVDNNTNLLNYAAYIVTFGKSVAKAEQEPHAILYENYVVIDAIAISDTWKFYNWSEEKGLYGEPIGDATLRNIQFLESADYTVPKNAKKIEAPN